VSEYSLPIMSTVSSSNTRGPRPLWSSAPPQIGWLLAACYGSLLTPAIAGVIFQWQWPITAALLLPGIVTQITLGHTAARRLGIPRRTFVLPLGTRMLLGGVAGLTGALAANVHPRYFAPLVFVLVLTLIVDPMWRITWKRTSGSHTADSGLIWPTS
jgi:hypothetical protein